MENVIRPVLARLGEQPDDDAGVDAARQQHADRHVGHHAALHRGAQRRQQAVAPLLVGVSMSAALRV
jgi:hypothetical protein